MTAAQAADPWIDSTEAAALLHCHVKTVILYARQSKVPARRYGSKWLFYKPGLIAPPPEAPPPVEKPRRGRKPKVR